MAEIPQDFSITGCQVEILGETKDIDRVGQDPEEE
jgi:hypothetical protein